LTKIHQNSSNICFYWKTFQTSAKTLTIFCYFIILVASSNPQIVHFLHYSTNVFYYPELESFLQNGLRCWNQKSFANQTPIPISYSILDVFTLWITSFPSEKFFNIIIFFGEKNVRYSSSALQRLIWVFFFQVLLHGNIELVLFHVCRVIWSSLVIGNDETFFFRLEPEITVAFYIEINVLHFLCFSFSWYRQIQINETGEES
jgi:hypothetical protein